MPGCKNGKTAKQSKSNWNEANTECALHMCREGKSICESAKVCGMSHVLFQNRFKMQEEGFTLVGTGKEIAIGEQKEKQLADCIKTMCNLCFSHSLHKTKEIL